MRTTTEVSQLRNAPIIRAGSRAVHFLAARPAAAVAAVFERSLYIEADGDHVCIGVADIGNGPINAIVEADGGGSGWVGDFTAGQRVSISHGALSAGDWRLDLSGCTVWSPSSWPVPAATDALHEALAEVGRLGILLGPEDGLAPLVLPGGGAFATALTRVAAPRVQRLAAWLAACAGSGETEIPDAPTDLLGLGPGLTPSGDDLVGGALIGLAACGALGVRDALAAAITARAREATTPLSVCLLCAAAEGQGGEALHDFVGALVGGRRDELGGTVKALSRIGHTSGWDALAGAVLAVSAFAAATSKVRLPQSP